MPLIRMMIRITSYEVVRDAGGASVAVYTLDVAGARVAVTRPLGSSRLRVQRLAPAPAPPALPPPHRPNPHTRRRRGFGVA